MAFEDDKRKYLERLYKNDNSKKGNVDDEIRFLIDKINSLPDYYTTSSCAGRIMLIMIPKNYRKDLAKWLFVSHKPITFEMLPLKKFPQGTVWFRQESMILHIACKSLESAQKILEKAISAGFKRSGITGTNKRFMVEITSTEKIDAPIASGGKLIVSKGYIRFLALHANRKIKRNADKISKFYKLL